MDNNLLIAIVTSVCTAGSTTGVAITALIISNKRMDRIEAVLDRIDTRFTGKFDSIDTRLEILTGAIHELDRRLTVIEDRLLRKGG